MRAQLSEMPGWQAETAFSVPVALDDDCGGPGPCGCGCDGTPDGPCGPEDPYVRMLELRRRTRVGYDEESGNPVFEWDPIARGGAMVYEVRTEFDPVAGVTVVVGDIRMANPGLADIKETCILVEQGDPEIVWMVTGQDVGPVTLNLKVRRIDG